MIQANLAITKRLATDRRGEVEAGRAPTIWGLSPAQVHDAYWRSKGVECVRRDRRHRLQRGAELFLLIEPDQLVLFNIVTISERLTWRNALVTRLRLIDDHAHRYSEHVVTDDDGYVERIERRYRAQQQKTTRVMLTKSRRIASIWMAAANRREGWDRVRRSVSWSRVDHWKCPGRTFTNGDRVQDGELLNEIVSRWPHPDQVISGLEEVDTGVWHAAGESVAGGVVRVGPLWIGQGRGAGEKRCLVGPAWLEDQSQGAQQSSGVPRLKDIIDVELPEFPASVATPPNRLYQGVKRMFDIGASAAALALLAPVMLAIAICIWIEDGRPFFFGHVRQGRGGKLFRCWKFRTMRRNAEKLARQLDEQNLCDGPQVYIQNDPRVTRTGRLLRRLNLDEVPQFWNVLIGEMSLVGPRPSPDDENQYCPAWRDLRLSVRPGITGLWQLNRTREPGEDFQEWIKYDIEYVQRASFTLDLMLLLRTAKLLLPGRSRGAPE